MTRLVRVGADIGGTFTDIVLDVDGAIVASHKQLTTTDAPERAVIEGLDLLLKQANMNYEDIDQLIHGTTLATNALIERKGAKTGFITTEGFRDTIEMRTESRFEQYDLDIVLPTPLIARRHRFTVAERLNAQGEIILALDEERLQHLIAVLKEEQFESLAIGFIHAYANPVHERRARDLIQAQLPQLSISISSEVSPLMREYERFNSVIANAYVKPRMARYLRRMQELLEAKGARCPLYLIHSGGGLISLDTAVAFPARLIESGPAGGAVFAAHMARQFQLSKALSYDMGGTTAKICLIDDGTAKTAQRFEVARSYRFKKGSGMPISIPVIEMVEIGAGGGSIAWVDAMKRIRVGPQSAGSEPGPACYGQGGTEPAITDADLVLAKIDKDSFAGGRMSLEVAAARGAIDKHVGRVLGLEGVVAAFGIVEVVDENMANAARVHAIENGKNVSEYTLIAFGGAAPLHVARLCEKLGVRRCLIPPRAGVGSAVGFLRAPFAYEETRSALVKLSQFDSAKINAILKELASSCVNFVAGRVAATELAETRTCFMRYAGQGWEIPVSIPTRRFAQADRAMFLAEFQKAYTAFFSRPLQGLEGLEIEIVSWSIKLEKPALEGKRWALVEDGKLVAGGSRRAVFDSTRRSMVEATVHERKNLTPGSKIRGPAIIVESETSTQLDANFDAVIQRDGSILMLERRRSQESTKSKSRAQTNKKSEKTPKRSLKKPPTRSSKRSPTRTPTRSEQASDD